jgi:hypothetical protein
MNNKSFMLAQLIGVIVGIISFRALVLLFFSSGLSLSTVAITALVSLLGVMAGAGLIAQKIWGLKALLVYFVLNILVGLINWILVLGSGTQLQQDVILSFCGLFMHAAVYFCIYSVLNKSKEKFSK